jgi:hypothetical protein
MTLITLDPTGTRKVALNCVAPQYILVEHALSSARPAGIRARAGRALPEVLSIVLGHAPD